MSTFLSIVIPLHNEADRLNDCLFTTLKWLAGQSFTAEILLVENGSSDETLERAYWWTHQQPTPVRVLTIPQRSKALAVAAGMLAAEGRFLYMADVDLSTPIHEIPRFLQKIDDGHDVVIGSRRVRGARVRQSFQRRVMGLLFGQMSGLLLPGIRDTQCGFKMFTQRTRGLFVDLTVTSLAFDVEVLLRARQAGLSIYELPVTWNEAPGSRVRPVRDGLAMLKDLWSLSRLPRQPALAQRLSESR